jgi:hypothetical protein
VLLWSVLLCRVPPVEQISNLPLSYVRPLEITDPCSPKRPADASLALMPFLATEEWALDIVKRMTQACLNRSHSLSAGALHRGRGARSQAFTAAFPTMGFARLRAIIRSGASLVPSVPRCLVQRISASPIDTNSSQHEGAAICASGLAFSPWVV